MFLKDRVNDNHALIRKHGNEWALHDYVATLEGANGQILIL